MSDLRSYVVSTDEDWTQGDITDFGAGAGALAEATAYMCTHGGYLVELVYEYAESVVVDHRDPPDEPEE